MKDEFYFKLMLVLGIILETLRNCYMLNVLTIIMEVLLDCNMLIVLTIIMEVLFMQGAGVHQTDVIQGMVFKRAVEGELTKAEKCKIAVYSCPLDILQTETKVGDYS